MTKQLEDAAWRESLRRKPDLESVKACLSTTFPERREWITQLDVFGVDRIKAVLEKYPLLY